MSAPQRYHHLSEITRKEVENAWHLTLAYNRTDISVEVSHETVHRISLAFDKRFLDAELGFLSKQYCGEFTCSMLAARRVYQEAPNHQLGTLVSYTGIPSDGTFHRALYDSEMTAKLWPTMLSHIGDRSGNSSVSFKFMQKLTKTPKGAVDALLANV